MKNEEMRKMRKIYLVLVVVVRIKSWSAQEHRFWMVKYIFSRPKKCFWFLTSEWRKKFSPGRIDFFFPFNVYSYSLSQAVFHFRFFLFNDQATLLNGMLDRRRFLNYLVQLVVILWNICSLFHFKIKQTVVF